MKFTSTRNKSLVVSFENAVLNCLPEDGGLFVPCETEDLRKWISHIDETTSFSSIAGTLSSAFLREEFSPIICETIASRAFPFSPEFKQLDENLFVLDLSTGPTGKHRDFGISYLSSFLETVCQYRGKKAVYVDATTGELGASVAVSLRGKKNVKAVLIYPKGSVKGLEESDFIWNGGNIYPVEIEGDEKACHEMVREILSDKAFVQNHGITLANTINIGRLLPQAFFYPFAFSRIKSKVKMSIDYTMAPGNFSNLVAGLYAWQFALPVNGFTVPATKNLVVGMVGEPVVLDSIVPLENRNPTDPTEVSNIERLEDIFSANSQMMKHFIFPQIIEDKDVEEAAKELFKKYGFFGDRHTARAYASMKKRMAMDDSYDAANILIARDNPAYSLEYVTHVIGETPAISENIKKAMGQTVSGREVVSGISEIRKIIESL